MSAPEGTRETNASIESLRALSVDDADAWGALEQRSTARPWTAAMVRAEFDDDARVSFGVIDDDGSLLGVIATQTIAAANEVWILNVLVDPAARRRGIANSLVARAIAHHQHAGFDFWLEVRAGNVAARALYEKHGFVDVARRRAYYPPLDGTGPHEDACLMKRTA